MTQCDLCLTLREEPDRVTPAAGLRACPDHIRQVTALVVAIARRAAYLSEPDTLITTKDTDTERWVGSRAPLDTTAIAALDRRTIAGRRGDPISAERVLRAWLYAGLDLDPAPGWWRHDDPMPRFPLAFICTLLVLQMPMMAGQPAFVRFAQHIAAVHRYLERLTPSF